MKVLHHSPLRAIFAAAFFFLAAVLPGKADDGLFAIFQTSRGTFTARLDYDKVPATVANFVGLVEGTRVWLNAPTGALRAQPFYDGLTFHRAVPGSVIQTGSRNGLGTDGPGYTFGDQFDPDLRHNSAGVLSMANSGPNSNGSQFLITLASTPSLNGTHVAFGQIVSGMNVVNAIGAVATPVQAPEVVTTIQSITISRIGAAAEAFSASGQWGLPELTDAKPAMIANSGNFFVKFSRSPFSQYLLSRSDDLIAWIFDRTAVDYLTAPPADLDVTAVSANKSQQFFRLVKASYPQQTSTFVNKTLSLQFTSSNLSIDYAITGEPRGEYDPDHPLGTVLINGEQYYNIGAYLLGGGLNNQELIVAADQLPTTLRISLKYRTPTEGWFTAQDYNASPSFSPFFGTFNIQATP